MEETYTTIIVAFLAGSIFMAIFISFAKHFGFPGLTGPNYVNQDDAKKLRLQNEVLINEIKHMQSKVVTLDKALEMATGHSLLEGEAEKAASAELNEE
ncbi:MAG: hypothetical protein MK033_00055 [Candidatus Caenarcaniphilales bacterium]|nr:hypothetical protein [Candidatus Caenarcaniphilales bacterium]